ncbi:MAG: hypothetical protein RLZZ175_252 [Bacteroidota bacterium]|jgi:hypothetical protein
MKKHFITVALGFALLANNAFASFPVVKKEATKQETSVSTKADASIQANAEEITSSNETISEVSSINDAKTVTKTTGDNEMLILLALWFFLGGLAAHRWYKGKPAGYNILFILTAGGCGIWAIIDLINIITGKF